MAPLPALLAHRVADGFGHLLRADADAVGLEHHTLSRWVREGHLEALGHGEYVITRPHRDDASPFEIARADHLRRAHAVLAGNPHLHLVAASSALALGLPTLEQPHRIHVSGPGRVRPYRSLLRARMPWGSPPEVIHGLACQRAAEAVVEISALEGMRAGIVCADALAHRVGSTDEMAAASITFGRRPGAGVARTVAGLADPRIESPGESLLHLLGWQHGLPLVPQVVIRDGDGTFVARVDFLVEESTVVVEFDGLGKYTSPDALRAEKLRQARLERPLADGASGGGWSGWLLQASPDAPSPVQRPSR